MGFLKKVEAKLVKSFLKKVQAKILSDKERVLLNQKQMKEDGEFGKKSLFEDSKLEQKIEKALDYSKKGNVLKPNFFSKKEHKEIKDITEDEAVFIRYLSRFPGSEKAKVKKLMEKVHDEPYSGLNLHNNVWSDVETGKDLILHKNTPDLKGTLGKDVPKGGVDPFIWSDAKYSISKNLLLKHKGKPLTINTRSDLIAHDDYMDALDITNHKINMHILSAQDQGNDLYKATRHLEPGAPSLGRRLKAIKKLADAGFKVTVMVDVLDHPKMDKELKDMFKLDELAVKRQIGPKIKIKENKVKLSDAALKKVMHSLEDVLKAKKSS